MTMERLFSEWLLVVSGHGNRVPDKCTNELRQWMTRHHQTIIKVFLAQCKQHFSFTELSMGKVSAEELVPWAHQLFLLSSCERGQCPVFEVASLFLGLLLFVPALKMTKKLCKRNLNLLDRKIAWLVGWIQRFHFRGLFPDVSANMLHSARMHVGQLINQLSYPP